MGVALSIFAITTALFLGQIGNIDWLNITQGKYVFQNEPVVLLDSIRSKMGSRCRRIVIPDGMAYSSVNSYIDVS